MAVKKPKPKPAPKAAQHKPTKAKQSKASKASWKATNPYSGNPQPPPPPPPTKSEVYEAMTAIVDLEEMPSPMEMWDKPQGLHKAPTKGLAVLLVAMLRRHVNIKTAFTAAGIPASAANAWMADATKNPTGDAARLIGVLQVAAAQAEINLISLVNVSQEFRRFAWIAERRYGGRWNIEGETEVDVQPAAEPPKLNAIQGTELLELMQQLGISTPSTIDVEADKEP